MKAMAASKASANNLKAESAKKALRESVYSSKLEHGRQAAIG